MWDLGGILLSVIALILLYANQSDLYHNSCNQQNIYSSVKLFIIGQFLFCIYYIVFLFNQTPFTIFLTQSFIVIQFVLLVVGEVWLLKINQ